MNNCVVCSVIGFSTANGSVTVGSVEHRRRVRRGAGFIYDSHATGGAVTGGGNSILGGFVGVHNIDGLSSRPQRQRPVTGTGPSNWVGGFVGYNGGVICDSTASGAVTGTSSSILGGFAGVNIGWINPSSQRCGDGDRRQQHGRRVHRAELRHHRQLDVDRQRDRRRQQRGRRLRRRERRRSSISRGADRRIRASRSARSTIRPRCGNASGGSGSTVGAQVGVSNPSTLPTYPTHLPGCDEDAVRDVPTGILPA